MKSIFNDAIEKMNECDYESFIKKSRELFTL